MRILLDARMYGLENSGIGRYIMNLVQQLSKLDNEDEFKILLRSKYFNQINLPNNWEKILTDFGHYGLEEQIKLTPIIKKYSPDLVHFPHFNLPLTFNGKFVVTIHDMTMHSQGMDATTLPVYKYYVKRLPYKLIFSHAAKSSVGIFTPSQSIKDQVLKYYKINPAKIHVTHEGFSSFINNRIDKKNPDILEKNDLRKNGYFLYVGNLYPHKNLKVAVAAITKLNQEQDRKIILAVAGKRDKFKEKFTILVKHYKAEEYVRMLGFVSDEELQVLYKNSISFLYPSLSEGFGLQGIEAIASGSLVIASNIPVFKEVYENNVQYFDPLDTDSLIDAMKNAMKISKQEKMKRIVKSKKFIERYSWQKMAQETLSVYRSV